MNDLVTLARWRLASVLQYSVTTFAGSASHWATFISMCKTLLLSNIVNATPRSSDLSNLYRNYWLSGIGSMFKASENVFHCYGNFYRDLIMYQYCRLSVFLGWEKLIPWIGLSFSRLAASLNKTFCTDRRKNIGLLNEELCLWEVDRETVYYILTRRCARYSPLIANYGKQECNSDVIIYHANI